jgi:hypothetical protein
MDSSFDSDDLSTAFGTETIAEREMVPEGFDNAPNSRDSMPIELVGGRSERAFSSAKKLITPERNALADTTIEATECLKAWWDQGLIHRD